MAIDCQAFLHRNKPLVKQMAADATAYYPKAIVLFGSFARCWTGMKVARLPKDVDLLIVGSNDPHDVARKNYGLKAEVFYFHTDDIITLAKSLRYDSRPVLLSKLYSKNVAKQHARDVIAACLLLGAVYPEYGIQQIDIEGRTDKRDYSAQHVLFGRQWWDALSAYARQRRGPMGRFSDKIVGGDRFRFSG
jgi:hypothetical protein